MEQIETSRTFLTRVFEACLCVILSQCNALNLLKAQAPPISVLELTYSQATKEETVCIKTFSRLLDCYPVQYYT